MEDLLAKLFWAAICIVPVSIYIHRDNKTREVKRTWPRTIGIIVGIGFIFGPASLWLAGLGYAGFLGYKRMTKGETPIQGE